MNYKMPLQINSHTEESQSLPFLFPEKILKKQNQSPEKESPYLFSGHLFQPTLKIASQRAVNQYQKKETNQNYSYREIYQSEANSSPSRFSVEKQQNSVSKIIKRKKSIHAHLSPELHLKQFPVLFQNLEGQQKTIESLVDEMKEIQQKYAKQEYSPLNQLIQKNSPIGNFYYLKNMKQLYPFQIEKSIKDLMPPIHLQQQPILTPIYAEKSLIYPMQEKYSKPKEQLEKLKNKLLKRKKTIYLPDIQNKEDPIVRKLKHFQRSTFESQCIHMVYIRPSAIRIQKYSIADDQLSEIIKKCMSYRWWWQQQSDPDDDIQFLWTFKPSISFLSKQRSRHISDQIEFLPFEQVLKNSVGVEDQMKFAIEQKLCLLSPYIKVHNHIEASDQIWTKKNLICQLTKYCFLTKQKIDTIIPQSLIVDGLGDEQFYEFVRNYKTSTDIWIVQSCDNNINQKLRKVCENTRTVFQSIHKEYQMPSRLSQSFTIQKYIRPFIYQQLKLDLNYFMLVTQINGIIRVYLYEQFYGKNSQISFSPFEKDQHLQSGEKDSQVEQQLISKNQLIEYFDQHRIYYEYDIFQPIQDMMREYIKSIYIQMPIKDHNFELFQVIILIDSNHKPWLIDTKPLPEINLSNPLLQEIIPQLVDNAIQLSIDVLFPSPSIWPKEKRKQIEIYPEQNDFVVIFDSRLDAQGLKSLFEEKAPESQIDDI